MTTSNHDDDPVMRDPRFDAAWRAASRETPPPALDDAIRAAARREVSAGPQREITTVSTSMRAKVREATRPEKWWGPLAAAATIGAIAVGVLQLAPQDRDPSADGAKAVVSDMPADTGATRRDARLPAAASAPARESAPAAGDAGGAMAGADSRAPTGKPALEDPIAGGGVMPSTGSSGSTGRAAPAPIVAATPPKSLESEAETQTSRARAEKSTVTAAPAPLPHTVAPTPASPAPAAPRPLPAPISAEAAPASAPPRTPQPFPAEIVKRGVAADVAQAPSAPIDAAKPDVRAKEEAFAVAPRKSAGASAMGAMTSNATGPADPDALRDKLAAAPPPAGAGTTQAAGGAVARERAGSRGDSPSLAAAPAAMPQRDAAAEPARQLATAKVAAKRRADPAVDAKAKERARLPVADWIALIRKLRDEGRLDDVALELKAFRAVHADAQTLLPPDLRDAPPGTR